MNELNEIGLREQKVKVLAQKLNELLANYSIFYQNTRGYHWDIKGERFFELHIKFEELYNDLVLKIDEVAERILTLGHIPNHKYSEYIGTAKITESEHISDGIDAMAEILNSFKIIIKIQRELLSISHEAISHEADDEGTNALMSDYIRKQEKLVGMYTTYLN